MSTKQKSGNIRYKGCKIWYTKKVSTLAEVLLFRTNAPDNLLEREQGMKRDVSVG